MELKNRQLLIILLLALLCACNNEQDYCGKYMSKHKYGIETITLYSNKLFEQIYVEGNRIDTNKGVWRLERKLLTEPDRIVLDGWIRFKDPIQSSESKYWEHTKTIGSFYVSDGCIVTDPDFQEFNPCK